MNLNASMPSSVLLKYMTHHHPSRNSNRGQLSTVLSSPSKLSPMTTQNSIGNQIVKNDASHTQGKNRTEVYSNLDDILNLFDSSKSLFVHFPSPPKFIFESQSLGTVMNKINFQKIDCSLNLGNFKIEKTNILEERNRDDSADKISLELESFNSFSSKMRNVPGHRAETKTVSSVQSLNFVKKKVKRVPRNNCGDINKKSKEVKKKIIKFCNCRNSKCLKLYCECFKQQGFCSHKCSCTNCFNTADQGKAARELEACATSPETKPATSEKSKKAEKQSKENACICRCRRSNCLKSYCDCFANETSCGDSCGCQNCKNFTDLDSKKLNFIAL